MVSVSERVIACLGLQSLGLGCRVQSVEFKSWISWLECRGFRVLGYGSLFVSFRWPLHAKLPMIPRSQEPETFGTTTLIVSQMRFRLFGIQDLGV